MRLTNNNIGKANYINKKKIEELKEKVKSFEQENNDLQQKLLLAKKEKLEQTNQAIETSQREQALLEEALRRSDIYAYCYRAIEDSSIRLTETERTRKYH